MDSITSAEFISDLLAESEHLNLNKAMIEALCKARYETMCRHSPVQKYRCSVEIQFMPQSGQDPICCDTCLQKEIQDLIRNHGVWTIGSCCGHGVKQGYIQVADRCVNKMIEMGYVILPVDKYGHRIEKGGDV